MRFHTQLLPSLVAAILLVTATVAGQAKPAAGQAAAQPATPTKLTPAVKGEAELAYVKPAIKRDAGNQFIVTTFKIQNLSNGSIAGLKVEEFWYDKAGNIVSGDTYRHRKPLQPKEVLEFTLKSPVSPTMARQQYKFAHANGGIKTKEVPKL